MAVAIVVALATQFAIGQGITGFETSNFFSYFTVLSNVIAVAVLLALALGGKTPDRIPRLRGAATLYMGVTGIIYVTLLLPLDTDVGVSEAWIDWIIHGIGPLFMILDWTFNRPFEPRPWSDLWGWLVFPAAYLGYTLVRGPIVDWYPYPFLDPRDGGYGEVALGSVVVLIAILGIGVLLVGWSRLGRHRFRSTV